MAARSHGEAVIVTFAVWARFMFIALQRGAARSVRQPQTVRRARK
jgi:hypothetical protein